MSNLAWDWTLFGNLSTAAATVVLTGFAAVQIWREHKRTVSTDRQLAATAQTYGMMVRRSLLATVRKLEEDLAMFTRAGTSDAGLRNANAAAKDNAIRTSVALDRVEQNLLRALEAEFERRGGGGELGGVMGSFQVGADLVNTAASEGMGAEARQTHLRDARRRFDRCGELLESELQLPKRIVGTAGASLAAFGSSGSGEVKNPQE